jgi:2-hydroxy-6-oxonona-2,4-dienedioate hydrolase
MSDEARTERSPGRAPWPGPALPRLVDTLGASARVHLTPCADGALVWRSWGEGRPLVLLHGGGGSWEHWARNIGPLSHRHQVWCPDLPAFGDSADPLPPGGVDEIAAAVADGLDLLLPGPHAFDLAGFSFGGMVGTTVADLRPGRIRRLVLVGVTSLGLIRRDMPLQRWRLETDPARRLAMHRANLETLMVASRDDDPDAVALHARNVERARFNGKEAARTTRIRDLLGGIVVGTVAAIYGEHDTTTNGDVEAAHAVLRRVRPDVRFVSLPGAGHWVQYEAAEAFDAALLDLLAD